MPIPRGETSIPRCLVNTFYSTFVVLILLLPYLILAYLVYIIICVVIFPITLYYVSSNFGMRPWHARKMQAYIDAVQRNHPFMVVVHKYKTGGTKPSEIEFYPHKRGPLSCIGTCCICSERFSFSALSGVLSELESAGWRREVVYDFFQYLSEQSGATPDPEFHAIAKKICSHKIHYAIRTALVWRPWEVLWHKLLPKNGEVQMWEGIGKEEIASFKDLRWMAKQGSVIKPQTFEVLRAIESMDTKLGGGIWKFATAPTDVAGTHWQTVVRPEGDEI